MPASQIDLSRDLMTAEVRRCAKESLWQSPELALVLNLAACGQFLQPLTMLQQLSEFSAIRKDLLVTEEIAESSDLRATPFEFESE
jgi:hypothetical protein